MKLTFDAYVTATEFVSDGCAFALGDDGVDGRLGAGQVGDRMHAWQGGQRGVNLQRAVADDIDCADHNDHYVTI